MNKTFNPTKNTLVTDIILRVWEILHYLDKVCVHEVETRKLEYMNVFGVGLGLVCL